MRARWKVLIAVAILAVGWLVWTRHGTARPLKIAWQRDLVVSSDYSACSVTMDAQGNAYLCGNTYRDLSGKSTGADDFFVAKYSPDGVPLWMRQFVAVAHCQGVRAAPDVAGGLYVAGSSLRDEPSFLVHLSSNGGVLWRKSPCLSQDAPVPRSNPRLVMVGLARPAPSPRRGRPIMNETLR